MLSLNDIINVGFRKSGFSGYRTEDVDGFVDKVRESYDELLKRCTAAEQQVEQLKTDNQQNVEKLKVLAAKIEEYRGQEDEIKNALISAQKLGEASVREARHKAEIIIKDADLRAENIVTDADQKIIAQKKEMERLQKAVSDFRSKLLGVYKEHLTLIDALPTYKPEPAPQAEAVQQEVPPQQAEPAPQTQYAQPEPAQQLRQEDVPVYSPVPQQETDRATAPSVPETQQPQVSNFDD